MRPTKDWLENRRRIIEADLVSKLEARDYHGVCDAAMDLREIDARVSMLSQEQFSIASSLPEHTHDFARYDIADDSMVCACGARRGGDVVMDPPHPGLPDLEI